MRVYNNTYLGIVGNPYYIWRRATGNAQQLDVKNNIFYDTSVSASVLSLGVTNTAAAYPGFSLDYNCYHSSAEGFVYQIISSSSVSNTDPGGLRGYGWETHGLATDPGFSSLAGGTANSMANNYGLQSGPPCVGA